MNKREALKKIIMEKGIVISDKPIPLSSGKPSFYYYNLKNVMLDPKGISLLGELLLEKVREWNAKSVGGLELAAIPIATAITFMSSMKDEEKDAVSSFIVRKQRKTHGLKNQIEGHLVNPVVVVDDVITKGESIKKAMDSVNKEGHNIAGVVCVVDREEDNVLKEQHIKYTALFTHSDFKDFINEKIKEKQKEKAQQRH